MNNGETKERFASALEEFKKHETDLLKGDANERTLTHRLALYLGANLATGMSIANTTETDMNLKELVLRLRISKVMTLAGFCFPRHNYSPKRY